MDSTNVVPLTQKPSTNDMYSAGTFRDGDTIWQPRGAYVMCIAGGNPNTVDAQTFSQLGELSIGESIYMTCASKDSVEFDLALAKSVVDAGRKLRLFITEADYLAGYDVERIVDLKDSGKVQVFISHTCLDKLTIPYLLGHISAVTFLYRTDDPIYALSLGFSEELASASVTMRGNEALVKDATGKQGIGTPIFRSVAPSR